MSQYQETVKELEYPSTEVNKMRESVTVAKNKYYFTKQYIKERKKLNKIKRKQEQKLKEMIDEEQLLNNNIDSENLKNIKLIKELKEENKDLKKTINDMIKYAPGSDEYNKAKNHFESNQKNENTIS